jgi:hypothetical protein
LARDRLFLLAPGFEKDGIPSFCGPCAMVEGFLGYFPQVRETLEIVYYPFPRPRAAIVDLVGEANQSMPVLVLAGPSDHPDVQQVNGNWFVIDPKPICRFLAERHGLPVPLG